MMLIDGGLEPQLQCSHLPPAATKRMHCSHAFTQTELLQPPSQAPQTHQCGCREARPHINHEDVKVPLIRVGQQVTLCCRSTGATCHRTGILHVAGFENGHALSLKQVQAQGAQQCRRVKGKEWAHDSKPWHASAAPDGAGNACSHKASCSCVAQLVR